jgi:hypothetical protein
MNQGLNKKKTTEPVEHIGIKKLEIKNNHNERDDQQPQSSSLTF